MIENKTNFYEQNRSTKTSQDRPTQIVPLPRSPNSDRTLHTIAIDQFRSHTIRVHMPTTDTNSRLNCLRS